MEHDRRPIGFWLKHLDRLIEAAFERELATRTLTRRHWQVLNILDAVPASRGEVGEALAPFLAEDRAGAGPVIDDLAKRAWVAESNAERLALTEEGRRVHTAISERVTATRAAMTEGVSAEEYMAVVATLRRMASNLESLMLSFPC